MKKGISKMLQESLVKVLGLALGVVPLWSCAYGSPYTSNTSSGINVHGKVASIDEKGVDGIRIMVSRHGSISLKSREATTKMSGNFAISFDSIMTIPETIHVAVSDVDSSVNGHFKDTALDVIINKENLNSDNGLYAKEANVTLRPFE